MGLASDKVLQYLRRIDIAGMTKRIKLEKKRGILKKIFMERTNCSSWEEAEENFEPYVHIVEEFLGSLNTLELFHRYEYHHKLVIT